MDRRDDLKRIIDEYLSVLSTVKLHLSDLAEAGFTELRLRTPQPPPPAETELKEPEPEPRDDRAPSAEPPPSLFGGIAPGSIFADYDMERLKREAESCRRCGLWKERRNVVFGVGDEGADLMFVGEAPGRDEDLQGEPFVGRAGQLLNKLLGEFGISRSEVYITNVLKCRPPKNRDPLPSEVDACEPFLIRQIELIKPKLICALGRHAAYTLLKTKAPLNRLRGRFHNFHRIKLLVTYHPASVLRNPNLEKAIRDDLRRIKREYGRV